MFSCRGIKLAVDWFLERGHKDITVFVPAWRKEQSRPDALITGEPARDQRRFALPPVLGSSRCWYSDALFLSAQCDSHIRLGGTFKLFSNFENLILLTKCQPLLHVVLFLLFSCVEILTSDFGKL